MKKNTILILLFIFWVSSARSQSKNEQITTLSQQLQDLEVEISTLKKKIVEVKKDLSSCIKEISSKNEKLLYTDNQLNILKDSIELLNRQIIEISNKNLLNESRNSRDFKTFLSTFLSETFSGKNFDSIVCVSSPVFLKFIEAKSLGFGRFFNSGMYCTLYNNDGFGYFFNEAYFGQIEPDISNLVYFQNKEPEGGSCEEATSSDGIYYNEINELPRNYDVEKDVYIPSPNKYKNLRKIRVGIQLEKFVRTLYFIEFNTKWYLLYIDGCDCGA